MFILTFKNPALVISQIAPFLDVSNLKRLHFLARQNADSPDFKVSKRQTIFLLLSKISTPEQKQQLKDLYNKLFNKDEDVVVDANEAETVEYD